MNELITQFPESHLARLHGAKVEQFYLRPDDAGWSVTISVSHADERDDFYAVLPTQESAVNYAATSVEEWMQNLAWPDISRRLIHTPAAELRGAVQQITTEWPNLWVTSSTRVDFLKHMIALAELNVAPAIPHS